MECEHRRFGRGAAVVRVVMSILIGTVVATAARAQTAPAGASADALTAASRAAFEALSEVERKLIQDDLVWAGIYRGMADGGFGKGTLAAITSYELSAKTRADGILDVSERAALTKAADAARQAVGWKVLAEPASGARIGYPSRLMPTAKTMVAGALYSDAKGTLALNVERAGGGAAGLAALYDRLKADQPGRKVTYAVQKPDWFVLTAEAGGRRSYTRFAATPAGPVGFTFAYDAGLADGERLAVAIANAFEPVAAAAVAAGAPTPVPVETIRPAGAAVPASPASSAVAVAAAPTVAPKPVAPPTSASALVVAPGRAVTADSAARLCPTMLIGGKPARLVATKGAAALLAVDGLPGPTAQLALAPAGEGDVVALLQSIADGAPALTAATGTVTGGAGDGRLVVAAARGVGGAAVFDRGGRLVGLAIGPATEPRAVGGVAPEMALALVPAADVKAVLDGDGVALATAPEGARRTVGELTRAFGPAVVALNCGR
jgi:hypothetical protein